MNARIALVVVASGVALGAIAFAVLRPDRRAAAQPVRIDLKPRPPAEAANAIVPPLVVPSLPRPQTAEAITEAAVAVTPPAPMPAVRVDALSLTPKMTTLSQKGRVEISIQDGKSYDFSTGRAVPGDTANDKAAIDAALREIELATEGMAVPATPTK